jgi:hypothetical protein
MIHVAGGTVALLTGLVAMLLKKSPGDHATSGNIYYWGMMVNGISALVMTLIKFNLFFLVLGVFSLYLVHTGKLAIRYWRRKQSWDNTLSDMIPVYTGLMSSLVMILYPVVIMINSGKVFVPVLGVFGLILLINSVQDLIMLTRKSNRVPRNKKFLISHIGKMGGSYIAATTAFLVNNIQIDPMWIIWLLPTVAGSILIASAIRKWKGKLQIT